MYCKMVFIGGRVEGEPGGVAEAIIEAGCEGVKEVGVAGGGGGGGDSEEGDSAIGIKLGCEGEKEGAVGVLEDLCCNIRKGSSDRVAIGVGEWGLLGGEESSGCG